MKGISVGCSLGRSHAFQSEAPGIFSGLTSNTRINGSHFAISRPHEKIDG